MSNGIAHGDLLLFDCPRIRKSEFWQFIKLVAPHATPPEGQTHWLSQDANDAFCLKCNKMLRFTKGSSNSVRRHMERFHRKELQKRQAQSAEAKKSGGPGSKGSPASSGPARKNKRVNPSAEDGCDEQAAIVDATTPIRATSGANNEVHTVKQRRTHSSPTRDPRHKVEALVKWLAMSLRPLSIVEDPGFGSFAHALGTEEQFVVPSREALYHCLELMSESVRFDTKQTITKNVTSFAISVDTWKAQTPTTAPTLLESHSVIKCWHLTEDFAPRCSVLDIINHASLDGEKVAQVVEEYALQKKLLSLVTVEESGAIEGEFTREGFTCLANVSSTLNSLVRDLLSAQDPQWLRGSTDYTSERYLRHQLARMAIREAVEDVLKVIQWVQSDAPAATQFQVLYPDVSSELLKFSTLEVGRWGIEVAHDTISRAILLREALGAFLDQWLGVPDAGSSECLTSSMHSHKPKPESWLVLEGLLLLWRPLYEIHQVTASERVCSLPFVLPIITMAKHHFGRADLFLDIKHRHSSESTSNLIEALECTRAELQFRLDHCYGDACKTLGWIAALDPRYGRLRHMSDAERDAAKEELLGHALDLFTSQLPPLPAPPESLGTMMPSEFEGVAMYGESRVGGGGSGLMHRLLFDEDEDVAPASDTILSRDAEIAQTRLFIADEITLFFNEHQLRKARVPCPLQWWCANRERFPFLAPLARMWLCTRAGGKTPPRSRASILSAELCESLGSQVEGGKWLSHARNLIELHTHFTLTPTGVSL